MIPSDLNAIAEIVAKWADDRPCVRRVYLYGSRVRGDHRPESDVDVFVAKPDDGLSDECLRWWQMPAEERFGSLRMALHSLDAHIGYSIDDPAGSWVRAADYEPSRVVLRVRKAWCVLTPPKLARRLEPAP